jgi:hypothetical protein
MDLATQPSETKDLTGVDSESRLVAYLESTGQEDLARQLQAHLDILAKDPEGPSASVESLRSLVTFLCMSPQLEPPLVISDPDGLMGLEWHIQEEKNGWAHGKGIVSLIFGRSGFVRYVALSLPHREGQEHPRAQGESPKEYVLQSLGEFASQIVLA